VELPFIVLAVGQWGAASFENDPASDWFLLVEEAVEPGGVIASALDAAVGDWEYLGLDQSCEAIAAAELSASCSPIRPVARQRELLGRHSSSSASRLRDRPGTSGSPARPNGKRAADRRVLSPSEALRRTTATDRTPFWTARTRVSALTLALSARLGRALRARPRAHTRGSVPRAAAEEVSTLHPV
jgi:hypothetical protein